MASKSMLAKRMTRHAAIMFPLGLRTFHISAQCVGTEITIDPGVFRTDSDPIVVHHSREGLQLWARTPTPRKVRVVVIDYREFPRQRTIMGSIWFGTIPGDIEVSDFSMSIAMGIFPDVMKENTVYVLGVRFAKGPNQVIPLTLKMWDLNNCLDFTEKIELVHVGGESGTETQYIPANAAISKRAQKHRKPDKARYLTEEQKDPQPIMVQSPIAVQSPSVQHPPASNHRWLTSQPHDESPNALPAIEQPTSSNSLTLKRSYGLEIK